MFWILRQQATKIAAVATGLLAGSAAMAQTRSDLLSFALSDGPHLVYVDADQHLNQFWYTTSTGHWSPEDLTATVGGNPPAPCSALTSFTLPDGPHVVYIDSNQHLNQLWYTTSAGRWSPQDLTETVGGNLPAPCSALTSFTLSDGPHLVYIDSDQHLNQLWYTTSTGRWRPARSHRDGGRESAGRG